MSCTVVAVPYALMWVVGAVIAGATSGLESAMSEQMDLMDFDYNDISNNEKSHQYTEEDTAVISMQNFVNKDFETPFTDKNILIKTLNEHGVVDITESASDTISGSVDGFTLSFVKPSEEQPYHLTITCLETENADEKVADLSSEYALNVQEEAYLSIIEKLKEHNLQVEEEEVADDNTIVLTVNLE